MCTVRGLAQLMPVHFKLGLLSILGHLPQPMVPCEQSFLSFMAFSFNKVVRMAYLLRSWFV